LEIVDRKLKAGLRARAVEAVGNAIDIPFALSKRRARRKLTGKSFPRKQLALVQPCSASRTVAHRRQCGRLSVYLAVAQWNPLSRDDDRNREKRSAFFLFSQLSAEKLTSDLPLFGKCLALAEALAPQVGQLLHLTSFGYCTQSYWVLGS
jgi:hypothetical protein